MAEERVTLPADRVEARLEGLENRLSRLEGLAEQMDRCLSNLEQMRRQLMTRQEQGQHWFLGMVSGTWVTLMLAILFKS